jgi:hypothetical protein
MDTSTPPHTPAEPVPAALRHLQRLTGSFLHEGRRIFYLHVYARPRGAGLAPPLDTIMARESGVEGIACVDDAARAALLALQVHAQTGAPAALGLARDWLTFVTYMREPDDRFANFILDATGAKNRDGLTSYLGGPWWTARAQWALAAAWRVTGDAAYRRAASAAPSVPVPALKITAVRTLALLEHYQAQPNADLHRRITALCDALLAQRAGAGYFRDQSARPEVALWGYHQLQAVARAGRLFARPAYLAACAETVERLIAPAIADGFYHVYPREREPQCAYDVAPLVLGLEELYRATGTPAYRALALEGARWLEGRNPAGVAPYDAPTGRCLDGVGRGHVNRHCGAESAIEAGFIALARDRLREPGDAMGDAVGDAASGRQDARWPHGGHGGGYTP